MNTSSLSGDGVNQPPLSSNSVNVDPEVIVQEVDASSPEENNRGNTFEDTPSSNNQDKIEPAVPLERKYPIRRKTKTRKGSTGRTAAADSNKKSKTKTKLNNGGQSRKDSSARILRGKTKNRNKSAHQIVAANLNKKVCLPRKGGNITSLSGEDFSEIQPNDPQSPSSTPNPVPTSSISIESDSVIEKELDCGNFKEARTKLRSCAKEAARLDIYWVKVRSYNFWPAQRVVIDDSLKDKPLFQQALKFKARRQDECFMFFGTSQIAYVNSETAVISWVDGLLEELRLIEKGLHRPSFKDSLEDVYRTCTRLHYYPFNWWREPKWHVLIRDFKELSPHIEELKENRNISNLPEEVRIIFDRANREQIYWSTRAETEDPWLIQVVPRHIFFHKYPQAREVENAQGLRCTHTPCRHFGNGRYGFVPIESMVTYLGGLLQGFHEAYDTKNYIYNTHPKRVQHQNFLISLGECWGFLQTPRHWPGGNDGTMPWWCENPVQELGQTIMKKPWREISTYFAPPYIEITDMDFNSVSVVASNAGTTSRRPSCGCIHLSSKEKCFDMNCSRRSAGAFCAKACGAEFSCYNQSPDNIKLPLVQPFLTSDDRGWGLRVEQDLRRGETVIEYLGEPIDKATYDIRLQKSIEEEDSFDANQYQHSVLGLGVSTSQLFIDSSIRSNECRFINSSCEPNCELERRYDLDLRKERILVVSKMAISKGTELTIHYNVVNDGIEVTGRGERWPCLCGTKSCFMLTEKEATLAHILIGKQVKMKWDCDYYCGTITEYLHERKKFRIQYMDGDNEVINLQYGGSNHPENNFKPDSETMIQLDDFLTK